MSIDLFIPFIITSSLLLIIPGPTIILVINKAMTHGAKSVVPLVAGVLLGDFVAMCLSLLGLGALLQTSATLFSILKWIGAAYLVFLGIKHWRTKPKNGSVGSPSTQNKNASLMGSSFIVTALNPKSIAFFVAFLPQFIDPTLPASGQMLLLGGTFLILATLNALVYAFLANKIGSYLKRDNTRMWLNRSGGTALIGAGIFTATMQRSN